MTGTARPLYFDHGLIEFSTKKDVKHYKVKVWYKDGMHQHVIESGKMGEETPEEIARRVQQMLGSVSKE